GALGSKLQKKPERLLGCRELILGFAIRDRRRARRLFSLSQQLLQQIRRDLRDTASFQQCPDGQLHLQVGLDAVLQFERPEGVETKGGQRTLNIQLLRIDL